jgi:hypothetical protein
MERDVVRGRAAPDSNLVSAEGQRSRQSHPTRERRHQDMLIGTSYPILNIFWTFLEFFLFFLWIWLAVMVFSDIFRSHDIGGGTKALWVIFIIVLPFVGVFAYLLFRGGAMHERAADQAALQHRMFSQHLQNAGPGSSTADQLHKLADLKDRGFITDAEFEAEKTKILG